MMPPSVAHDSEVFLKSLRDGLGQNTSFIYIS